MNENNRQNWFALQTGIISVYIDSLFVRPDMKALSYVLSSKDLQSISDAHSSRVYKNLHLSSKMFEIMHRTYDAKDIGK